MNAFTLIGKQNLIINQNNQLSQMCEVMEKISNKGTKVNADFTMINNNVFEVNNGILQVNKSIEDSDKKSNKFLSKIKDIGKNIFSLSNAKLVFNATIGGAAKAREQLIGFQNLMGDDKVGEKYMKDVQKKAIKSGFSPNDAVNNTRGFMRVTKNTDKLDKLNNMSQRLAITNPEKGVGDSGAAIQSAMSGKFDDLKNKFNFSDKDTEKLKGSKKLEDFMSNMEQLLNAKGLTNEKLGGYEQSPLAQVSQLKNNASTSLAQAGQTAMDALMPIMTKINEAFSGGQFNGILEGLAIGLMVIAQVVTFLFGLISPLIDMAINGFTFICSLISGLGALFLQLLPIILAVVTVWALYTVGMNLAVVKTIFFSAVQSVASFCTTAWAMAMSFLNLVMSLNPATLITLAFIGLAVAIATIGTITNGVRGALASAFGFIVDLAQGAINAVLGILNGAIRGINKVSSFFGNLLGIESKQIQEIEFKADFSKFKDSGKDFIENATFDDIKAKIGIDKVLNNKPLSPDMGAFNKNQLDNFNMPADSLPTQPSMPSMPSDKLQNNFNATNENLQNGNDKIDISNEHLEMLRDLAEIESVQNFVTLTPSVEITTGDIKEEADINTIISKIENYMKTELVNSAEGVYV